MTDQPDVAQRTEPWRHRPRDTGFFANGPEVLECAAGCRQPWPGPRWPCDAEQQRRRADALAGALRLLYDAEVDRLREEDEGWDMLDPRHNARVDRWHAAMAAARAALSGASDTTRDEPRSVRDFRALIEDAARLAIPDATEER